MQNKIEKISWLRSIPERFKLQRDVFTKDLAEFIKIASDKKPGQINLSVVEKAITVDGSPPDVGIIERFEFATVITFILNPKQSAIASYLENYPESKVVADDKDTNTEKIDEMKIRAILTAINRKRQIQSSLPLTSVRMVLFDLNGKIDINDNMLEHLYERNEQLRLSPFII